MTEKFHINDNMVQYIFLFSSEQGGQNVNRQDVLDKMSRLIAFVMTKPQVRKPTKTTAAAKRKRLEHKKRHALTKQLRSGIFLL